MTTPSSPKTDLASMPISAQCSVIDLPKRLTILEAVTFKKKIENLNGPIVGMMHLMNQCLLKK